MERDGMPMETGAREWRDGAAGCLIWLAVMVCLYLLAAGAVLRLKAAVLRAENDRNGAPPLEACGLTGELAK